jgi:hypothetical protein
MIVSRRSRDRFHQPDIVVMNVHQARDHAAIFWPLVRVCVLVAARSCFDRLPTTHMLDTDRD